jgi:AcrR family transcriptional regulator
MRCPGALSVITVVHMSGLASPPPRRPGRRDEYARQTRAAVVVAARALFADRGFVATTVDDIAASSRVSPGTVYQQCGGKHGLLRTLLSLWADAPSMSRAAARIDHACSGDEVFDVLGAGYLEMYRQFGDVIALGVAVAPHDEESARCLDEITANHRVVLFGAARRLRDLAVLGDGTSDDEFADVADFYFGSHGGIRFMATSLGWEPERATTWITTQFARGFGVDVCLDR